jgi:hypothetical protein
MLGGNVGKENQHVKCRRRCRDMIKKKQLMVETGDEGLATAERFYSLTA